MARRKPDDSLFALPAGRAGRTERAVNDAVRAARRDKRLTDLDGALVALARALARAVDHAEAARDTWAVSRAGGELRETLTRLRLDPSSRGLNRDALAEFLAELGKPAPTDAAGAAPMGDPADPGPPDVRTGSTPDNASDRVASDAVATRRGDGGVRD